VHSAPFACSFLAFSEMMLSRVVWAIAKHSVNRKISSPAYFADLIRPLFAIHQTDTGN